MPADPQVLLALEAAVRGAGPEEAVPLRVHLAGLYLTDGKAQQALDHAVAVLAVAPQNSPALSLAAAAASGVGRDDLAESYRRLAAALLDPGTSPPGPVPDGPPVAPPDAGPLGWPDDPDIVTFSDVAGMQDVKQRLHRSLLGPMRDPSLRDAFRKRLRGGLLLWGPPGTGKTFIARALSGELGATFLSATPADIYGSYFGESERNVARLFEQARREGPSVVFLDELDALGGRRSKRTTDQARGVVNQLLTELDGMADNREVYVLAATNAPWDVDDALRRPGRFDRTVLVLPPDPPAREGLLRRELRDRPTAPDLDLAPLVRATETYSGADLVRIVDAATERALERSVEVASVSPITQADLAAALQESSPSTRRWLSTAAIYLAHAAEDEDFQELRGYLRRHRIS